MYNRRPNSASVTHGIIRFYTHSTLHGIIQAYIRIRKWKFCVDNSTIHVCIRARVNLKFQLNSNNCSVQLSLLLLLSAFGALQNDLQSLPHVITAKYSLQLTLLLLHQQLMLHFAAAFAAVTVAFRTAVM